MPPGFLSLGEMPLGQPDDDGIWGEPAPAVAELADAGAMVVFGFELDAVDLESS